MPRAVALRDGLAPARDSFGQLSRAAFTQIILIGPRLPTGLALIDVPERARPIRGLHNFVTGQITYDCLKSFTVHAKHLAVFTPLVAEFSSFAGRIFSISRARARCKRERTVPIAQSITTAA